MLRTLAKILGAPIFLLGVILGWVIVFLTISTISIGGWAETVLLRLGYRNKPVFLPAIIGVVLFAGLGLAGTGILGSKLIGTPGVFLGPLLAMGAIAILDRW